MIGGDDDRRVLVDVPALEVRDERAELLIPVGDLAVVERAQVRHLVEGRVLVRGARIPRRAAVRVRVVRVVRVHVRDEEERRRARVLRAREAV